MPILAAPMFDDFVMMLSVVSMPNGSWSCKTRPAKAKCPSSQSNVSLKCTTPSFNAPETTTILNVEPGSITSLTTRSRRASAVEAPGLLGSKFGQGRHCQDFARARAHDDAGDADGRVFLHGVGQRGLDNVLNTPSPW